MYNQPHESHSTLVTSIKVLTFTTSLKGPTEYSTASSGQQSTQQPHRANRVLNSLIGPTEHSTASEGQQSTQQPHRANRILNRFTGPTEYSTAS